MEAKVKHPEVFNSVILSGVPGYGHGVKRKLLHKRNLMCEVKKLNFDGAERWKVVFYQPCNLYQEILNYMLKYKISIDIIASEITVSPLFKPEQTTIS